MARSDRLIWACRRALARRALLERWRAQDVLTIPRVGGRSFASLTSRRRMVGVDCCLVKVCVVGPGRIYAGDRNLCNRGQCTGRCERTLVGTSMPSPGAA